MFEAFYEENEGIGESFEGLGAVVEGYCESGIMGLKLLSFAIFDP